MPMFGRGSPFAGDHNLPASLGAMPPFAPTQMATPQIDKPRDGFFSRGGAGVDILGGIADGILAANGMRPVYQPVQQQRLQRQQELQDYDRKRNDALATWQAQQEWERAHPKPINNDTVNDYNFRVQTLGQDAADQWLRSQGDPIVTIPLGENRIYSGPRSGIGAAVQGSVAPQRPAIGAVVADPRKGGSGSGQTSFRSPNRF